MFSVSFYDYVKNFLGLKIEKKTIYIAEILIFYSSTLF